MFSRNMSTCGHNVDNHSCNMWSQVILLELQKQAVILLSLSIVGVNSPTGVLTGDYWETRECELRECLAA